MVQELVEVLTAVAVVAVIMEVRADLVMQDQEVVVLDFFLALLFRVV